MCYAGFSTYYVGNAIYYVDFPKYYAGLPIWYVKRVGRHAAFCTRHRVKAMSCFSDKKRLSLFVSLLTENVKPTAVRAE